MGHIFLPQGGCSMFDRNNRAKMRRNKNQIKSCSMQVELKAKDTKKS